MQPTLRARERVVDDATAGGCFNSRLKDLLQPLVDNTNRNDALKAGLPRKFSADHLTVERVGRCGLGLGLSGSAACRLHRLGWARVTAALHRIAAALRGRLISYVICLKS